MISILKKTGILFFLVLPAWANDTDSQVWTQFVSQGKLTSDLRLFVEFQPRYSFLSGRVTTMMLRPALGWQLSPEFTLWAGYGWTPLFYPNDRDEHRWWLQVSHSYAFGDLLVAQRLRMEFRYIETATSMAERLRYQLRFLFPLEASRTWSVVMTNELFLAFNQSKPAVMVAGFDQNRLFLGVNRRLSSELALEGGYLWNVVNRAAPAVDRQNHVLMLTLFHNFDFAVK